MAAITGSGRHAPGRAGPAKARGPARSLAALLAVLALAAPAAAPPAADPAPPGPSVRPPDAHASTSGVIPAAAPVCTGRDLIAALPAADRAALDRAVAGVPHATGIRFRATRGAARIEIVGTYHFDDPRHDPVAARVAALLPGAAALLVEAGPEEERALKAALGRDPSLMIDATGPTLPERLAPGEWQALARAMADRGMPAIMVSRLRPWYVSKLLGVSPCMIGALRGDPGAAGAAGLDHRLMAAARDAGTPIRALEPWDTVFGLFAGLTPDQELDMIRAALPAALLADDYAHTIAEAYFRGDIWAIWEFGRLDAYRHAGLDRAAIDAQVALAEARLISGRNASWIGPLTRAAEAAAAEGKPIVAAFGALHLPGEAGVLRRVEAEGWTVTGMAP